MRITGGQYVRRNIICPPGIIRPAMDRMRESLFSILGPLDGTSFLDLFSGSGCVAIEAASRGASPIHLVEGDRGKKETIEKNLSFVREEKHLFIMDVNRYLASCARTRILRSTWKARQPWQRKSQHTGCLRKAACSSSIFRKKRTGSGRRRQALSDCVTEENTDAQYSAFTKRQGNES